jgi:hypothetical protein
MLTLYKLPAEEVNSTIPVVKDAGVVCVVGEHREFEANVVGPLEESPTKNMSPPIGALRPAVFSNWVVLKFVRLAGAGII